MIYGDHDHDGGGSNGDGEQFIYLSLSNLQNPLAFLILFQPPNNAVKKITQ